MKIKYRKITMTTTTKITILKVYKAISDSLENYNIIYCIVLSITPLYLISIIKHWMGFQHARKHQQISEICTQKYFVVQCFILIVCNIYMYVQSLVQQYLLNIYGLTIKRIFLSFPNFRKFCMTL